MSEPPLRKDYSVPRPQRPPTGGRIVAQVVLAMVSAFVFAMGTRLLIFFLLDALGYDGPDGFGTMVAFWGFPIVGVAAAAVVCGRRGWKGAQIGLWIYVGLGILSTTFCGMLAASFHM